jgi:hypothetical protein
VAKSPQQLLRRSVFLPLRQMLEPIKSLVSLLNSLLAGICAETRAIASQPFLYVVRLPKRRENGPEIRAIGVFDLLWTPGSPVLRPEIAKSLRPSCRLGRALMVGQKLLVLDDGAGIKELELVAMRQRVRIKGEKRWT